MTEGSNGSFAERIDVIEEAYEFMLAYAAQGVEDDSGLGESVRDFLARAVAAMEGLADSASKAGASAGAWSDFLGLLRDDTHRARLAIALVLAQPRISSALIDNLNASIHLRTLLTDLFLIDEALNSGGES